MNFDWKQLQSIGSSIGQSILNEVAPLPPPSDAGSTSPFASSSSPQSTSSPAINQRKPFSNSQATTADRPVSVGQFLQQFSQPLVSLLNEEHLDGSGVESMRHVIGVDGNVIFSTSPIQSPPIAQQQKLVQPPEAKQEPIDEEGFQTLELAPTPQSSNLVDDFDDVPAESVSPRPDPTPPKPYVKAVETVSFQMQTDPIVDSIPQVLDTDILTAVDYVTNRIRSGQFDFDTSPLSMPESFYFSFTELVSAIRAIPSTLPAPAPPVHKEEQLVEDAHDERDRQLIRQQQEEITRLHSQLAALSDSLNTTASTQSQEQSQIREKQESQTREIIRLRQHLIDSEEMHTRDMLELSSQLETECAQHVVTRSKLETYQSMLDTTHQDTTTEIQALKTHNEQLQSELEELKKAHEIALEQVDSLQNVLEGLEASNQAEITIVTDQLKQKVTKLESELSLAEKRASEAETRVKAIGVSEEEARELKRGHADQLRQIENLQKQVSHLSMALSSSFVYTGITTPLSPVHETGTAVVEGMKPSRRNSTSESGGMIDTSVMANLLIQYLNTRQDPQKTDILLLICKVLRMTPEQRTMAGLVLAPDGKRYIRRRKSSTAGNNKQNGGEDDEKGIIDGGSLADMWISFLLNGARTDLDDSSDDETKPLQKK